MGRKSAHKLPEFVESLVATGVEALANSPPTDEVQARQVMNKIARSMCWRYARTLLYIPVFKEADLSERDEAIMRQYGEDGPDGARKYSAQRLDQIRESHGLTIAHLYAIINAQKRKRRQAADAAAPAGRAGQLETHV